MLCYVEDTCLAEEVQMDQVRLTPTLVVCGKYPVFSKCLVFFFSFLLFVYL